MKNNLISIIIPVYKTEKYINRCVDSVLNQTYKNLEIILVDDGSPDNCPLICDEYALIDSRIKVIHKENGGQSSARNMALDICKGDIIAFVDSDDWLELNAYEILIDFMNEEDLDVVFMTANCIQNDQIVKEAFEFYPHKTVVSIREIFHKTIRDEIGGQPWLRICKKALWDKVRFPEGRVWEDLAISHLPFADFDGKVGFYSKPLYNYFLNQEGTSLGNNPLKTYYIFSAFKDHYDYALKYSEEDIEVCLQKTATAAIGFIHTTLKIKGIPDNYISEVKAFLQNNKTNIKACNLGVKYKFITTMYFYLPRIYEFFASKYFKIRKVVKG